MQPALGGTVSIEHGAFQLRPADAGSAHNAYGPHSPAELVLVENEIRCDLKQRLGERNYKHWFEDCVTLAVNNDELIVGVASTFLLNWMQKQFRDPINCSASRVLGASARVRFEIDQQLTRQSLSSNSTRRAQDRPVDEQLSRGSGTRPDRSKQQPARRFASLATFVEGDCNRLTLTAVQQVCEAPGNSINPLFIHGGVGNGKTHLLEAIYGRIRHHFPSFNVMYLPAENFANYFTQALREKTLPSLRHRLRGVDVLLLDDVDFLDDKPVIQEEFLHTFKQLENQGKQLVITSDRHPRLLSKSSDELVTRFLSGMVCRLDAPDPETRRKIVELKAARLDAEFTPDTLAYVAQRFRNNVRELEGALNCLQAYFKMTKKKVGVTAARSVLAELERDCVHIVRIADVERVVCEFFGVDAKELRSARRSRSISQPRMLAMYLARKHTQSAYSEIGAYFGGRNHSTVMSAEKTVVNWLAGNNTMRIAVRDWTLGDVIETLEQQLLAS